MTKNTPFDELAARVAGMTPARAEGIKRGELSLTEDLDERIAGAAALDAAGATLLGYDVRHAGRAKHKDVRPYAEGDPRADAWARGQAQAPGRDRGADRAAVGRARHAGPPVGWRTEAVAILATETPLTADQARGFVDAARDLDGARQDPAGRLQG